MLEGLLKGTLMAFWRRWFGGATKNIADENNISHSNFFIKLLDNRGTQYIVGIILFFILFMCGEQNNIFTTFNINLPLWLFSLVSLYNSIMLYALFWSKGHGPMLDVGGNNKPSQDTINRYNKMWFTKYLDRFFDKYRPEAKYGVFYDWISMTIRYTYPTIFIAPFSNWSILLLGPIAGFIYATFAYIGYNDVWVYEKCPKWLDRPIKWSEICLGFIVGCII